MARAWPFENRPEGSLTAQAPPRTPQEFVDAHPEGTEAIVVRIGLHDAELVLVDGDGRWDRWVYPSVEECEAAASPLGIPVHVGEFPEATRVRMNAWQRPAEDFERGAYPEQGQVGPVIPYPENRPRSLAPPDKEVDSAKR